MSREQVSSRLEGVKRASRLLRGAATARKNTVLEAAARLLLHRTDEILAANSADLDALVEASAFRDRLTLDGPRISAMTESLRQVAALEDPVGELVEERVLANGLRATRVRSPLGVLFLIYESRPNVAIEAFSLAFKAGNAVILRGGKESRRTTAVLYAILAEALASNHFDPDTLWGITDPDRKLVEELLRSPRWIDVVVPRGGDKLIEYVSERSLIPVIKNDRGLCHVYVHEDADLSMAVRIVENAKTQRPGVCNAMETLLVHAKVAPSLLPALHAKLADVHWFCCPRALTLMGASERLHPATEASFDTEYLDSKASCRVVDSLSEAIAHIERHGSRHSEAIITASREAARRFESEVDAAAVYWNASTRFTDGFELGLGGELGISTQKLHVRGPVGLRELTSVRWIIEGEGQVRK